MLSGELQPSPEEEESAVVDHSKIHYATGVLAKNEPEQYAVDWAIRTDLISQLHCVYPPDITTAEEKVNSMHDDRSYWIPHCFACHWETCKPLYCSACKVALYCGVECSKIAWKNGHKKKCKALADLAFICKEKEVSYKMPEEIALDYKILQDTKLYLCWAQLMANNLEWIAAYSCQGSRRIAEGTFTMITIRDATLAKPVAKVTPCNKYKITNITRMKRCLYQITFKDALDEADATNSHVVLVQSGSGKKGTLPTYTIKLDTNDKIPVPFASAAELVDRMNAGIFEFPMNDFDGDDASERRVNLAALISQKIRLAIPDT